MSRAPSSSDRGVRRAEDVLLLPGASGDSGAVRVRVGPCFLPAYLLGGMGDSHRMVEAFADIVFGVVEGSVSMSVGTCSVFSAGGEELGPSPGSEPQIREIFGKALFNEVDSRARKRMESSESAESELPELARKLVDAAEAAAGETGRKAWEKAVSAVWDETFKRHGGGLQNAPEEK